MTATPPTRIDIPIRPTTLELFNSSAIQSETPSPSPSHNQRQQRQALSPLDTPNNTTSWQGSSIPLPKPRRWSNRQSFSATNKAGSGTGSGRRPSHAHSVHNHNALFADDDMVVKLPTLVPGIRPAYSTPLPLLPMIVLCIVSRNSLVHARVDPAQRKGGRCAANETGLTGHVV